MNRLTGVTPILSEMDTLSPSGYAIALHIEFNAPRILHQTYNKAWTDIYAAKGYVLDDPTVHWGFTNRGAERWSVIAKDDPKNIFGQAAEFGLVYGLTHSLEKLGSHSMASFARADREFSDAEIARIGHLLEDLHDASAKVTQLSHAELNALRQMALGKSADTAKQDLEITGAELKRRLASAREKLGTSTTRKAVEIALADKLFEL